jgi:hypothetical protein
MRLSPRGLKGKIEAAVGVASALLGLGLVMLVMLVTCCAWLWYVVAAILVLYGAATGLAAVAFIVYVGWRRRKLVALMAMWNKGSSGEQSPDPTSIDHGADQSSLGGDRRC